METKTELNKHHKSSISGFNFLYLCNGYAGICGLRELYNNKSFSINNLLVFTYGGKDNEEVINFCKKEQIKFSLDSINSDNAFQLIKHFRPDLLISMHYRNIISKKVLKMSTKGGINLHPSILPKYRGCFSNSWALINMEKEVGITYHFIEENIDTGNIILQKKYKINDEDTAHSLFFKSIELGVKYLVEAINLSLDVDFFGSEQSGVSSYYKRNLPYNGIIDNAWTFEQKKAFVKALYFPPHKGAVLIKDGKKVEILSVDELVRESI